MNLFKYLLFMSFLAGSTQSVYAYNIPFQSVKSEDLNSAIANPELMTAREMEEKYCLNWTEAVAVPFHRKMYGTPTVGLEMTEALLDSIIVNNRIKNQRFCEKIVRIGIDPAYNAYLTSSSKSSALDMGHFYCSQLRSLDGDADMTEFVQDMCNDGVQAFFGAQN